MSCAQSGFYVISGGISDIFQHDGELYDFPEIDVLRDNRIYGPLFDAVG